MWRVNPHGSTTSLDPFTHEDRAGIKILARSFPGCVGVDNQTVSKTWLRGRLA